MLLKRALQKSTEEVISKPEIETIVNGVGSDDHEAAPASDVNAKTLFQTHPSDEVEENGAAAGDIPGETVEGGRCEVEPMKEDDCLSQVKGDYPMEEVNEIDGKKLPKLHSRCFNYSVCFILVCLSHLSLCLQGYTNTTKQIVQLTVLTLQM